MEFVLILWFMTGKKEGVKGILRRHGDKSVSHRVLKHSVTWAKSAVSFSGSKAGRRKEGTAVTISACVTHHPSLSAYFHRTSCRARVADASKF